MILFIKKKKIGAHSPDVYACASKLCCTFYRGHWKWPVRLTAGILADKCTERISATSMAQQITAEFGGRVPESETGTTGVQQVSCDTCQCFAYISDSTNHDLQNPCGTYILKETT